MQGKTQKQAMVAIKLALETVSKANIGQFEAALLEPLDETTGLPQRTIPASQQLEQMAALRKQVHQLSGAYQLCKDNMAEVPSAGAETLLQISHEIERAQVLINAVSSQQAYLDNKDQIALLTQIVSEATHKMHRVPADEAKVLSLCESQDGLLQASVLAGRQALDNFNQSTRENLIKTAPPKNTDIYLQQITTTCDKSVADSVQQVRDFVDMVVASAEVARQEEVIKNLIKEDVGERSPAFNRLVKKDMKEDANFQQALVAREQCEAKYSGPEGSKMKVEFDRQNLLGVIKSASDSSTEVTAEQRYRQNVAASQQLQTQLQKIQYQIVNKSSASSNYQACEVALLTAASNFAKDIEKGQYDQIPQVRDALIKKDYAAAMAIIKADPDNHGYLGVSTNVANALESQQNIVPRKQLLDKLQDKKNHVAGVYLQDSDSAPSTMAENPKVQEYAYKTLRRADVNSFNEISGTAKGKQEAAINTAAVMQADPEVKQQVNDENKAARQFIMDNYGDQARAAAVRSLKVEANVAENELNAAKDELAIAKEVAQVYEGKKLSDQHIEVIVNRIQEKGKKCSFDDVEKIARKFDQPADMKAPDSPSSSPKSVFDRLKVVGRRRATSDADLARPQLKEGSVKRSHSDEDMNRQGNEASEKKENIIAQFQEKVINLELNSQQKKLIALSAERDVQANRSNTHVTDQRCMQSFVKEMIQQENPGLSEINTNDVVSSVVCQQVIAETVNDMAKLAAEGQYDLQQTAALVATVQKAPVSPSPKASSTSSMLNRLGGRGNASELAAEKEQQQQQKQEAKPALTTEPVRPTSANNSAPESDQTSSYEADSPRKMSM